MDVKQFRGGEFNRVKKENTALRERVAAAEAAARDIVAKARSEIEAEVEKRMRGVDADICELRAYRGQAVAGQAVLTPVCRDAYVAVVDSLAATAALDRTIEEFGNGLQERFDVALKELEAARERLHKAATASNAVLGDVHDDMATALLAATDVNRKLQADLDDTKAQLAPAKRLLAEARTAINRVQTLLAIARRDGIIGYAQARTLMHAKPGTILHNGVDTSIRAGSATAAAVNDVMRSLFSWFQDQCVSGKRLGDVGEATAKVGMVYLPECCVGCDGTCRPVESLNPVRPCEHLPEPGAVVFYNGVYRVDSVMRSVVIASSPDAVRDAIAADVAELGFQIDPKRIVAEEMTTRDFPKILDRMCTELGADHAEVLAHLRRDGMCFLRSVGVHGIMVGDEGRPVCVTTSMNLLVGTLAEPSQGRHQLCKEEAAARGLSMSCAKSWDCVMFDDEGEPRWPTPTDCGGCEFAPATAEFAAFVAATDKILEEQCAAGEAARGPSDPVDVEAEAMANYEYPGVPQSDPDAPATEPKPKRSHKAKPKV